MKTVTRIPLDDLDRQPVEETLTELHERGFTFGEIVDFVDENENTVRKAMKHHGLDTSENQHVTSSSHGQALWQMDPDDLGGGQK